MASSERRYTKTVREASPADALDDAEIEAAEIEEDEIEAEIDDDHDDQADDADGADDDDDVDDVDDAYAHRITLHEEELAQRRQSAIAAGRRKGGALGAAMAGAMLAVQEIIEKPKEDAPVVVEANSKPEDLDSDGITVELDGTNYHTPALERIEQERKTGTL